MSAKACRSRTQHERVRSLFPIGHCLSRSKRRCCAGDTKDSALRSSLRTSPLLVHSHVRFGASRCSVVSETTSFIEANGFPVYIGLNKPAAFIRRLTSVIETGETEIRPMKALENVIDVNKSIHFC